MLSASNVLLKAQGIKGEIINEKGEPIPFATVYTEKSLKGTISDNNGIYYLKLPKGDYNIIVKHLSYKTKTLQVQILSENFVEKNVSLESQNYILPNITVTANNEDPAYYIMRKAMAMSQYYLNQVSEYDCRVYLKGTGFLSKIPVLLKKTMKKEGIEENKVMTMENITDIHFELPDKIHKKVIAMKTSFEGGDMEPLEYISLSLYNEMKTPISPLDKRAFSVYKFKLENTFTDQDRSINKIKVIPRRKGFDLYSGYIYIAENYWNIHSADLELEQKLFTVRIKQIYAPVSDDVWMPISHNLNANVRAMGFEMNYNYVASVDFKNIKLNKDTDQSIMQIIHDEIAKNRLIENEILNKQKSENSLTKDKKAVSKIISKEKLSNRDARKLKGIMQKEAKKEAPPEPMEIKLNYEISDSATNLSVSYWDSIRPVPLSLNEKDSYKTKDSIQILMENPEYKDSVKNAMKKFKFKDIPFGNTYIYENADIKFFTSGITSFSCFTYNTVEGLKLMKHFWVKKEYKNGKSLYIRPDFAYSLERNTLLYYGKFDYEYMPLKRAKIIIEGGRKTIDYNNPNHKPPIINMLTTLMLKDNFAKLYEKDYVKISHETDIINGLELNTTLEYAYRKQLENNSDFFLLNPLNNEFTVNIPDNNFATTDNLNNNTAFVFSGKIQYTHQYRYKIRDNKKIMAYSDYPSFSIYYKQGINNVFNSNSLFSFIQASVNQSKSIGFLGYFNYNFSTGLFLNKKDIDFADFKSFNINPSYLASNSDFRAFRLLNYYSHNTNDYFVEGHLNFVNNRLLLKHLPILNKTLMRENIYLNYLKTGTNKDYFEVGYGLDQLFLMFNIEIFTGFESWKHKFTGIKIVYPIFSGGITINAG